MQPEPLELTQLRRLSATADGERFRSRTLVEVPDAAGRLWPVVAFELGPRDRSLPTFGLFGGVHGLERVGSAVVLAFWETLLGNLRWDRHTQRLFERCRLVSIPIVNPVGMVMRRRSNGRGVDLMRNAPVEKAGKGIPLLQGHRFSPRLPWYRGAEGEAMEPEAQALVDFVEAELFEASTALALDVHSGFGMQDRLWYPYAKQSMGFPRASEARRLGALLDASFPHHVYRIEPQADSYTTHGDLWDLLFDRHAASADGIFLPWTLEMGSWRWLRKSPLKSLSRDGRFNPILPHRRARVLRRHLALIDFLLRAVKHDEAWAR